MLKGHKDVVFHGAFSPDGKTLATASWDGTVRLWQVETGQELLTLAGSGSAVFSVAFAPDGRALAAGCAGAPQGTALLWRADSAEEADALER